VEKGVGTEKGGGATDLHPIPDHPSRLWLHLLEGFQSGFCVGLLPHAHKGVEGQDEQDDRRLNVGPDAFLCAVLLEVGQAKGHHRCQEEDLR